jgi:tetratricopeptide (TPR) repeat protein
MRALNVAAALLLVAACAATAFRVVLPPLSCDKVKARANAAATLRDRDRAPRAFEQNRSARQTVVECTPCLQAIPNDADMRTLLASSQHALGMDEEAERNYLLALTYYERAETYAYLGLLQLGQGRFAEARQNLYRASLFNISFSELVSSPMREEIYDAVMKRHERLRGGRSAS